MALGVQQQVTWLQISVQQVGRVHILETLQHLVDDVLLVDVLKDVGPDNSMHICVHEVED